MFQRAYGAMYQMVHQRMCRTFHPLDCVAQRLIQSVYHHRGLEKLPLVWGAGRRGGDGEERGDGEEIKVRWILVVNEGGLLMRGGY